jgi:hypothetical protein
MTIIFTTLKKILFWCYERGTWQYDLMCVLILAFIFLAPNWIFNGTGRATPDHAVATRQVVKDASHPEADQGLDKDEKPPSENEHNRPAAMPQDR